MFNEKELKEINQALDEIVIETKGGLNNILAFDKKVSEELRKFDPFFERNVFFIVKDEEDAYKKIDLKILMLVSAITKKSFLEIASLMKEEEFSKIPVLDQIIKIKMDKFSDTIYDEHGIKKIEIKDDKITVQIKEDATPEQVERIMELNKRMREKIEKSKISSTKEENE